LPAHIGEHVGQEGALMTETPPDKPAHRLAGGGARGRTNGPGARRRAQRREDRIRRNARYCAAAMFVLFLLTVGVVAANVTALLLNAEARDPLLTSSVLWYLAGGALSSIYLGMRWRVIWRLGWPYNVLGIVGGVGHVALPAFCMMAIKLLE
jgi:hypothetical protein